MSARWRPQYLSPLQNPQKQWITNYRLTKIALGKALDFSEEASNTARLKTKNDHIEKHRKYFTSVTLPPRPEELDGKRGPFGGISFYKEKKSRSNPESLTARILVAFATKDPHRLHKYWFQLMELLSVWLLHFFPRAGVIPVVILFPRAPVASVSPLSSIWMPQCIPIQGTKAATALHTTPKSQVIDLTCYCYSCIAAAPHPAPGS